MKEGTRFVLWACPHNSIDQGHRIKFHNSSILAMKTSYMDRIVREAIEIERHPYSINRECGFCPSKSWKPLIGSLKLSGHNADTLGTRYRNPKRVYKKPQPHTNLSTEAWNLAL
jgi:hypothetical protein